METEKIITWADLKKFCDKMPKKFLNRQVLFDTEDGSAYINEIKRVKEPHIMTDEGIEPKSAFAPKERVGMPIVWEKGYPMLWSDKIQYVQ